MNKEFYKNFSIKGTNEKELEENPRSRSARLRCCTKLEQR
jgi:16S rRNA C1402 N4-methylase RsmH